LIVLDRDGVLNRTLPNPREPRPDSPMRESEVALFPWVPEVLRDLTVAGFGLAVVTNQPAWAKGKTTREDLQAAHARVLRDAQAAGGVILSAHVCLHRAEDGCRCRKPGTGLLEEAFAGNARFVPADSWMVGDRATDVLAGAAYGMKTALLGEASSEDDAQLAARAVHPSFRGADLRNFAEFILGSGGSP
jgi:histidinol-phosphate phosphatase family protein